jgi:hypothetical protein
MLGILHVFFGALSETVTTFGSDTGESNGVNSPLPFFLLNLSTEVVVVFLAQL